MPAYLPILPWKTRTKGIAS